MDIKQIDELHYDIEWKAMMADTKIHTAMKVLEVLTHEVSALYELTPYQKLEKFTDSEYRQTFEDIDIILDEVRDLCKEISDAVNEQ